MLTREQFAARHGLDASRPIVALLPGSRRGEIERHYPVLVEACDDLSQAINPAGVQFVLAAASGLPPELFARLAGRPSGRPKPVIHRIEGAPYDALAAADCAVVASGTATVEAALLGTPMVVIYRVAPLTGWILRRMIRTPHIGMVNLIAGRMVAPELIQDRFTPEAIAGELRRLLESSDAREQMKADLAEVRTKLGPGGAIERAADVFARMI
jgi:lipid-A-disaccharide synthase